jgi:HEAT repeat protein
MLVLGCRQDRDRLLAELQNTRPEIRAVAVQKLQERFDADDLGLFTQAARDPVAMVRAEAMTALGKSQDARVVDLLSEALGDPDDTVQINAAAALAALKTEKAKAYLTLQYARRGRSVRMAIVKALKGANMPGATANVVAAEANTIWERNVKILVDGSPPERVAAAEELGRSGRPDAVNRLVPLLKEPHVMLVAAAARGLGYARDARAVPALIPLLQQPNAELSESAAEALAAIGDNSVVSALAALAKEKSLASTSAVRGLLKLPRTPEVDEALCEVLMSLDDSLNVLVARELQKRGQTCSPLLAVEGLKNSASQLASLRVLGVIGRGDETEVGKIAAFLTSPDAALRAQSARSLGQLKNAASVLQLQKALDLEIKQLEPLRSDWVKEPLPAAYALGFNPEVPLSSDNPAAVIKMKTNDLFRRIQARDQQMAKELGKTMVRSVAPREFVDDTSEENAMPLAEMLRALGRLKDPATLARAQALKQDDSSVVRAAAFSVLAYAEQDVKQSLFDSDRTLQSTVAQALVDSGASGQRVVAQAATELSSDRVRLIEALRSSPHVSETCAPALLALVKEGGPETGTVALMLSEMKSPLTENVLLEALKDPALSSRRDVLMALGKMHSAASIESVAKDLFSESPDVRAAAVQALVTIGPNGHAQSVEALKGDYYLKVREAAGAKSKPEKATP